MAVEPNLDRPCWFVGARFGGKHDQTKEFIKGGIWKHDFSDPGKLAEVEPKVKSMQVGDRIAIKGFKGLKKDVPFDNKEQGIHRMDIKATGIVSENLGDGHHVRVEWDPLSSPRKWFFYTHQDTIWQVTPDSKWQANALIAFTFDGEEQDYDRFCDEYLVDNNSDEDDLSWILFYTEVADKIWEYRNKRYELTDGIHAFSKNLAKPPSLQDQLENGDSVPLRDICPFTVMGLFNSNMKDENRLARANALANFLKVQAAPKIPLVVPVLPPQRTWFFNHSKDGGEHDIGLLWKLFGKAIAFAASDNQDTRTAFVEAYDAATHISGVKWNITMGLYWIRPLIFFTLDEAFRPYLSSVLDKKIPEQGVSGQEYLDIIDSLKKRLEDTTFTPNSFPELSRAGWKYELERRKAKALPVQDAPHDEGSPSTAPYTVDDILAEGCFMERKQLEEIQKQWKEKHNLILQGPPGTGKTWLAKRLAYALIGEDSRDRVRAVQFHPNLSYEDFVRGWRPDGKGSLTVMNGPFVEMIEVAKGDPSNKYVMVIEEVNRGDPAKIFGELLTLLESDKRDPKEALELTYQDANTEPVYVPKNLYVIGTMNIADRSLALVDLALRRRFAFVDLEPTFDSKWQAFVQKKYGESKGHSIDADTIKEIGERMKGLNKRIAGDKRLGKQFRIGHSYVTPANAPTSDGRAWFQNIVDHQIGPLLEEYWFDDLDEAQKAKDSLTKGF